MKTRKFKSAAAFAIACAGLAASVHAEGWLFRVGGHYVDPKAANHSIVNVDPSQNLTFDVTYQNSPHWSVELLAALPFRHDINLNANGSRVAEVKHLPPTLTAQYNFRPDAKVRPYAGLGANATLFFDEKTRGALAGTHLSLHNSFGAAAQVGIDVDMTDGWFLNLDARWIDIDTRATLSGANLGMVHIEPLTFGLSFGHRFGTR